MIAQLLESVKLEGASEARAALVAIRDHLVGYVLVLNQTVDLLDVVAGTSAPVVAEPTGDDVAPRRGRKPRKKRPMPRQEKKSRARPNGHANGRDHGAPSTRDGKPTIASRIRAAVVDAPKEGLTADEVLKLIGKGVTRQSTHNALVGLARKGEWTSPSRGHYRPA